MRYTFIDFLEDCRRALASRVVRIVLWLALFKLLAMWGLPDQSSPLADAILSALDFLLLGAIAHYRINATARIDVGPKAKAARVRRAERGREPVQAPLT